MDELAILEGLRPACADCGRGLVTQHSWRKMTPQERAEQTAVGLSKAGNARLCNRCYRRDRLKRGTLPRDPSKPALGRPRTAPTVCGDCGRRMVSSFRWRLASLEERQELRREGYVAHAARDLCRGCQTRQAGYF